MPHFPSRSKNPRAFQQLDSIQSADKGILPQPKPIANHNCEYCIVFPRPNGETGALFIIVSFSRRLDQDHGSTRPFPGVEASLRNGWRSFDSMAPRGMRAQGFRETEVSSSGSRLAVSRVVSPGLQCPPGWSHWSRPIGLEFFQQTLGHDFPQPHDPIQFSTDSHRLPSRRGCKLLSAFRSV